MLQVARLAPHLLSDAADLVRDFFAGQQCAQGGFLDRGGNADLYYTVFGLNGMLAMDMDMPTSQIQDYLQKFGNGEKLDFVHRCGLIRCWANAGPLPQEKKEILAQGVEAFRTADGGYHPDPNSPRGNAYGAFLGLGARQDLGLEPIDVNGLKASVQTLATPDGAFSNEPGLTVGTTTATAAAIAVLKALDSPINPQTAAWLKAQQHGDGGFFAVPFAPMPDLLSTATALHALAIIGCDISDIKESCLDYVDSLWVNQGGFYGNWGDDRLDCEYTFYGLLALGNLA